MGCSELFAIVLIMVCSVNSFPRARSSPQQTTTLHMHNSTIQRRVEPHQADTKAVKFPNTTHGQVLNPSEIVRSPQGGWARGTSQAVAFTNNSRVSLVDSESITFPDEMSEDTKAFVPKIGKRSPECAKSSTFCEMIDDYPSNYLDNILQNTAIEFRSMFGQDFMANDGKLLHRIDALDENPLCVSQEQVVYPKTAKNKDDKWLFVVNQGQYTQGVRIEKCLKNGDTRGQNCMFTESFPLGYKASCKQKYIYRKLLALNEQGDPISDTFQLPSCCSCTVKTDHLASRQGFPGARQSPVRTTTTTPST